LLPVPPGQLPCHPAAAQGSTSASQASSSRGPRLRDGSQGHGGSHDSPGARAIRAQRTERAAPG
ncbi:MAG TPA: hypothetical protein VN840_18655, partial [Streptosporangiaceae bacterium]|nr:hypothetical protein [Streptosporangiaceae bacterium]